MNGKSGSGNDNSVSSNHPKEYVQELSEENARLNNELVKRDVKILTLSNRIKALEREIAESKPEFKVVMNLGGSEDNA